ncbi:MAG: Ldh family oxidoreductase [Alphaproteobacteria bacterium]|nr:Ldh family oxidoreductase [Alphaproteobacteria bacterium]
MPAPYETHRAQLKAILASWGMPEENAEATADILSWADLHGVDSHGMSMIPGYDKLRRDGRANMQARPRIIKETPVSALVDGDGGLGHVPAKFGMQVAIDKARQSGMAITAVRNSAHFGATGYYTLMAAKAGLIGMACTSASSIQVAPTFGKEAKLGTDPWSFAAPSADGNPFLLDMATTTVAAGRIRNKANEGLDCPPGWVLDREGLPSVDPTVAREKGGFLTSLGGSPENSSYKGYSLAVMVNILGACLSGATLITDPMHCKKPQGNDIGHCFIAIDPGLFREPGAFEADVARFCGDLRATTPVDPAQPVMVAGDPQWQNAATRMRDGIPVGAGLMRQIRQIAQASAAPWLLD